MITRKENGQQTRESVGRQGGHSLVAAQPYLRALSLVNFEKAERGHPGLAALIKRCSDSAECSGPYRISVNGEDYKGA